MSVLCLLCGAPCRRTGRVWDGGAAEDHKGQDADVHPVSDRAEEAEERQRRREQLDIQTDHERLKV